MSDLRKELFNGFDFKELDSPDFKEDSVREVLILPILKKLGYSYSSIVRSKTLSHPFIKVGSKKRQINLVPDYLMQVGDSYSWVLDAKSPNEPIANSDHVEQVYSYSMHPDVRTKFFALCNGHEFILFRQDQQEPLLFFKLKDINLHWEELERFLAYSSFQSGKEFSYTSQKKAGKTSAQKEAFEYLKQPLLEELPVKKRAAKRHFGVHGYFTRQVWNVVQEYIENFSQEGDVVLDSFGGSGITAIEALMVGRKAIHIDINPISAFMVETLTMPIKIKELKATFEKIKQEYKDSDVENFEKWTKTKKSKWLKKYDYPKGFPLPKGSDVKVIEELFSETQLAQLSYLKFLIKRTKDKAIQQNLLLAFSSLITKINQTYHFSKSGGGDSGVFRYYRYRIAPKPDEQNVLSSFEIKVQRLTNAKKEIEFFINEETIKNLDVRKGTATDLSFLKKESVDYIYTDPPYGKKIPYLDLSTMWNAWLDLEVTQEDFDLEAIEGGEQNKSKDNYNELITKSIQEMYRVLKFDRWMSFVFAHKDPEFWHLIIETAEACGFEYAGAVKQGNGQTSFKKRQNPFTVITGQLIINFKKVKKPRYILRAALGMNIGDIIVQTCEGIIAKNNGATIEQINDELIIKGLELGFLDLLKKEYSDLTPFLLDTFDFDEKTQIFTLKKDKKFTTQIDLNLRVKYYLISFLRRMELENKTPSFDKIIWHILPLLKNGVTPEEQTILFVLEDVAEKVGEDAWRIKKTGQGKLFV